MARYCRALRVVIHALAGLSLLLGSLPAPGMQAAPPPSRSVSIDAGTAGLDPLAFAPHVPPVASRTTHQVEQDLAGWYLRPPAAAPVRAAGERSSALQAAGQAMPFAPDGRGSVRDFVPRSLPLTWRAESSWRAGSDSAYGDAAVPPAARLSLPAWQTTVTPTVELTATAGPTDGAPVPDPVPVSGIGKGPGETPAEPTRAETETPSAP